MLEHKKNLGPSGVTVVIAREELLTSSPDNVPTMLRYSTYEKNNSLYNTPPSFAIYMVNEVLKWIQEEGGLEGIERINQQKAALLYDRIDSSEGFYRGCVDVADRSIMNVTFRLANEDLEKQFIKESEQAGFIGLKGHRSVGGLRASIYNAVPLENCQALAEFMDSFKQRHS